MPISQRAYLVAYQTISQILITDPECKDDFLDMADDSILICGEGDDFTLENGVQLRLIRCDEPAGAQHKWVASASFDDQHYRLLPGYVIEEYHLGEWLEVDQPMANLLAVRLRHALGYLRDQGRLNQPRRTS